MYITVLCVYVCFVQCILSSVIKTACPFNEVHKSCSFYEEYTCWDSESLDERVMTPAKRLTFCKPGCFCRKGMVRNYPHGTCIPAQRCRDLRVEKVLEKRYKDAI